MLLILLWATPKAFIPLGIPLGAAKFHQRAVFQV